MQHWLLVRGRGERPLERLHGDQVTAHSSSKRPTVEAGDLAVLYASVWQAVYGLAEIAGPPENDPARTRWAWRFPLRPRLVLPDLDRAPAVEEMGVFPSSLWRHSYVRLTPEQFEQAVALLGAALRFEARGTERGGRPGETRQIQCGRPAEPRPRRGSR